MPPLKGADKIQKKLSLLAKNLPKEVLQAATIEGELIMTDSKKNYVPVDLGTLRNSGKVGSKMEDGLISVSLSYGGAASPYALAIHEHLSEHSPPSWKKAAALGKPVDSSGKVKSIIKSKKLRRAGTVSSGVEFHPKGRGPKYLERPLLAAKPKMAQRMNERIQKKIDAIAKG